MIRSDGQRAVLVTVRVTPGAGRTRLAGTVGEAVRVQVNAPPIEGRANREVCALLADICGVRARDVEIVRGLRSRSKVLRVSGVAEEAVRRALLPPESQNVRSER